MISALFVEKNGSYFGLENVDPWDIDRDARTYAGPHAVVAHPPCDRWCQMAPVNQARYGHKIGDDAGCFASALASVSPVTILIAIVNGGATSMAGWFCLTCMKNHFSMAEIDACRAKRGAELRSMTPEQVREMLDYTLNHPIIVSDDET